MLAIFTFVSRIPRAYLHIKNSMTGAIFIFHMTLSIWLSISIIDVVDFFFAKIFYSELPGIFQLPLNFIFLIWVSGSVNYILCFNRVDPVFIWRYLIYHYPGGGESLEGYFQESFQVQSAGCCSPQSIFLLIR